MWSAKHAKACSAKKERTTKEKEKTKLFTQSKAASYKIYAIASKGSAKQERTAAFERGKEVKAYLLKKNYRKRRFSF
jgi:polyribonucleotide nucleotidyltransferase